ncbi:MAG: tetratricopeptide repeat protein [Methylobacter sp.]|nr:tetratricopeptide repeat protein [Methylobacter sp.]
MQQNSTTSTAALQQLADNGDAQVQFDLAHRYACGIDVVPDVAQALYWLNQSAEHGLVEAQLFLGIYHATSSDLFSEPLLGKEKNYYQIIYNWVTAGKLGFVEPSADLDFNHFKGEPSPSKTHTLTFAWFTKAASQYCAEAQYWLARCYVAGLGCEQSDKLAFDWFKKAAEQEFADAYYPLACCYRDGKGVELNEHLAFEWITKAVELADTYFAENKTKIGYSVQVAEVYYFLGDLYAQGKGIAQDDERAFKFYKLAANRGVPRAYLLVGNLAAQGKGCEKNEELAFKAYKLAAERDEDNQADAACRLALCYLHGLGTKQNDEFADEWFKKSAAQGKAEASYWLGYMSEHGFDPYNNERDEDEIDVWTFEYYRTAVERFEHAQEESEIKYRAFKALADCFEAGRGTWKYQQEGNNPTDFKQKAEQLYQKIGREKLAQLDEEEILTISPHSRKAIELLHQRIAIHISKGEFDLAKQFVKEVFVNSDYKETSMKEIALATIKKSEENLLLYKVLHEKEKEMLSFFTHTMRNALATAPESLRQAIRLLGSEDYEKNQKHYEAINEITALFSTITLTDCLIDTFKQSIYDTEEFQRAWQQDHTGDATPEWFIAAALRQSLNRIIFMEDATGLRKLINNQGELIKPTRKAFIEQVLPLDTNQRDVEKFYHWLQSITALEVNIEKSSVQFGANQIKFSLMFAISSELILNALKYWSGTGKIQIDWRVESEYYLFSVKNACKANASSQLAGTHKGLAFINRLIELLGEQAQFNCSANEQLFSAELKLHKTLLEG